jgi:Ca-activated chloride channel family protein
MTNNNNDSKGKNVTMTVAADRKLAWYRGDSVRFLVLDLQGKNIGNQRTEERIPLNLALIIDRSGSMQGTPLEAAKQAATGVVAMLNRRDMLTVVCFDNRVRTVVNSVSMDREGRAEAQRMIAEIQPGGTTDLEAGWLKGAEHVAENMEGSVRFRNHLVLLSDGMANAGETSPEVLAEYATGMQARGIITTTVGIGDHYSPEILQAIAEHGGGRMHDAERPEEIIEVVTAELGELALVVADKLQISIRLPEDTGCQLLSSASLKQEAENSYSCLVGTLAAERRRQLIFKVTTPAGSKGEELHFRFTASWEYDGGTDSCETAAILTLATGKKNNKQERDLASSVLVATFWQSQLIREITRINVNRQYEELRNIKHTEFRYFRRYCRDLANGRKMISQVERLLLRANRPMRERARKEMSYSAYKTQSCEMDHRKTKRSSWDSFIEDDDKPGKPDVPY